MSAGGSDVLWRDNPNVAVALLWLAYALKLAVMRASKTYTLRRSSLEIERDIAGKKIFTMSAAGFSDLR